MSTMSVTAVYQKTDPVIFIGAAVFTIVTVLISIRKPGKVASRVSPIEAVRYTEVSGDIKKAGKTSRHGARIHRMAISNLLRNKKKTLIVILSLSLSIMLLNSVYVFTNGFDLNKYVSQFIFSDFNLASANYFNVMKGFSHKEDAVPEEAIKEVEKQSGIQAGGKIYYNLGTCITEYSQKMIDKIFSGMLKEDLKNAFYQIDGKNSGQSDIQLYGMDDFMLKKLKVVKGKLDMEKFNTGNYIIEVVDVDDYGKPMPESVYYKPGDKVTLNYIDGMDDKGKITKLHNNTYEVMALVADNYGWDVRYYTTFAMILPSKYFTRDTGTDTVMSYQFDVEDTKEAGVEKFLKEYTGKINPDLSYESKETHRKEFEKFKNTYAIIGNALGLIVGIIGILNFINVILTGILTRRREFSILRSIGMTGRQLIQMLMYEGLAYSVLTILLAAVGASILNVTLIKSVGGGFWFFQERFSLLPVLMILPVITVLGLAVPLAAYKATNRQSIVDQLRVNE